MYHVTVCQRPFADIIFCAREVRETNIHQSSPKLMAERVLLSSKERTGYQSIEHTR